jgi:pimeloyl-ACP methyl ester carboxylesterase
MQKSKNFKLFLMVAALAYATLGAANGVSPEALRGEETATAGTNPLTSCRVEDVAQLARCGVFEIPENRDRPNGRRLPIHVVVIPATSGSSLKDPIVPLNGGPGEATISTAAAYAERFATLLRDRDLVLIDQRGTGLSAPLQCNLYSADEAATNLRDFFPVTAVKRCQAALLPRADLTQYSYRHFAHDIEYVRRALGYGPLNLYAGSYGTRAAQFYLRAYPQSVRTAYLGSVVPLDVTIPLPLAKAAQEALEKTFTACDSDADCHAAFPDLQEEFRAILARLDSGSVIVPVPGRDEKATLDRGRFVEWVRSRLYRPSSASMLPWVIHRAYLGDWSPVVEGILSGAQERDSAASFGLFFSITCNDDIAFLREADIVPATQGTFLGDYRVRQQQAACRDWPKVSIPPDYRTPVVSSVPTLFVSGDSDPATPLWFTTRVATGFSNRTEIVVGGQGHTEWSDCISRNYERLVRDGTAKNIENSCAPVARPRFKTTASD